MVLGPRLTSLAALAAAALSLARADDLCNCATECCNVDATTLDFTGKNLVELTYPKVSLDGSYSMVDHVTEAGVDTYDYEYVLKYRDDSKETFDRHLFIFSDDALDCTDSHIFVGSPDDTTSKRIPLVAHATEQRCAFDMNDVLTRAEISANDEIYLAFNGLVNDGESFYVMYDTTEEGLIVPEDDALYYPYVIVAGSAAATDEFENEDFFIDVRFLAQDVSVTSGNDNEGLTCLTLDEVLAQGHWEATAGNCAFTDLTIGTEDPTSGRSVQLDLHQTSYETCSSSPVQEDGDDLVFYFRLVLPRNGAETADAADDDGCRYFAENRNAQDMIIRMERNVADQLDLAYVNNFNAALDSITPVRCDTSVYPSPHSYLEFVIDVTLPGSFDTTFDNVVLPQFGEMPTQWDTDLGTQAGGVVCADPVGTGEEAVRVCQFFFRTSTCEPTFTTAAGTCAFQINTNRLFTGFALTEKWDSGQEAVYVAEPINSGVDNSEFDIELCEPADENPPVEVTDSFNVDFKVQNYEAGQTIDWDATDLEFTMNQDMIMELSVGQQAVSPFEFTDDLDLQITSVTVSLINPITDVQIATQTYSVMDKENFMSMSWTPYFRDPRFCSYHDKALTDRCGAFFDASTDRTNSYHDATWITDVSSAECQISTDNNNKDYFLFNPRTWFANVMNGYVSMSVSVTAVIRKCSASDNERRRLEQDFDLEVVFVQSMEIIEFLQSDDPVTTTDETALSMTYGTLIALVAGVGAVALLFAACCCMSENYGVLVLCGDITRYFRRKDYKQTAVEAPFY